MNPLKLCSVSAGYTCSIFRADDEIRDTLQAFL